MKRYIILIALLASCTAPEPSVPVQDCADKDSLIKALEKQVLFNLTRDDLELEDI